MSKIELKRPVPQQAAEQVFTHRQGRFRGMLVGIPGTEVPSNKVNRIINGNCYDLWHEGRSGTNMYSNQAIPAGTLNARADIDKHGKVLWQYGQAVYWSPKDLSSYTEIFNQSDSPADGRGVFCEYKDQVYLINDHVYRIVLDREPYIMYKVNCDCPQVLLTSVAETAERVFGYNYTYSLLRIVGDAYDTRLSGSVEMETGTCKIDETGVDYASVFFGDRLGEEGDPTTGYYTVPSGAVEVTHHGVYRTKNIGENSGGRTYDAGQWTGNKVNQFVWVDDIPVAKAIKVNVGGGGTVVQGLQGTFENADIGCTLKDSAGNTATILGFAGPNTVNVSVALPGGIQYCCIGNGRVAVGGQIGNTVTGTEFEAADVGRPVFWSDGSIDYITGYTNATTVTTLGAGVRTNQAYTMGVKDSDAGKEWEFRRKFADTIPDDVNSSTRASLNHRIESGSDFYIPRRFFEPFSPGKDIGVVDSGIMLVCGRDDADYQYSQIGDKPYCAGFYRPDHQTGEVPSRIRAIEAFDGRVGIFLPGKTYGMSLTTGNNVGNSSVGMVVAKLQDPYLVDGNIGVRHWQSIQRIKSGVIIAVTHEPAVRLFDGSRWTRKDFAVDDSGLRAVTYYLERLDSNYEIVSGYNKRAGYLIWFYIWEDPCDNVIQDTGGTALGGDDVWGDTGGTGVSGDDVIQDTGGDVC